jgi:alpha-galactosidase/6-phospho-beta-glucosidase family protein
MKKKIIDWFAIERELYQGVNYPGWAFKIWCEQNFKKLSKVLDPIREKADGSPEYKQFIQDADVIKRKYCKKDESGSPVLETTETGKRYVFEDDQKELFDAEISKLNIENDDVVKAYVNQINEYYKFIESEELEFDIKLLASKNIPEQFFGEHPETGNSFVHYCADLVKLD